ncbi:phosphotransferase [Bacillus oleivorans]|uniref:phosphotransferase n=1 Tax=Bacillus oleivorans TaxID=1448271 RepID=UPI0031841020
MRDGGDLHIKNILVNDEAIVCGVIDWGDMNIGHPACDISILTAFCPLKRGNHFLIVWSSR